MKSVSKYGRRLAHADEAGYIARSEVMATSGQQKWIAADARKG
jgi:hypothetical protein